MKSIRGEALRFLIAGGANTVLTYFIYLVLLNVMSYPVAFTTSFTMGILIAFILYSAFVFRTPLAWSKLLQYPILYALQYFAGLALLVILVEYMGLDKRIAPVINIIVLTPVTFILNKWFLSKRTK
jgi:putative flippase GtrA